MHDARARVHDAAREGVRHLKGVDVAGKNGIYACSQHQWLQHVADGEGSGLVAVSRVRVVERRMEGDDQEGGQRAVYAARELLQGMEVRR